VKDSLARLLFDCDHAAEVSDAEFISKLNECATAVIEGRKMVLEIEPVYGASALLLATSIEWLDATKNKKL
jgi:hypothetical protein